MSSNSIKLNLDSPGDLVFSISVDGTSADIREARFTIDRSPLKVSAIGEAKGEKFIFKFPPLEGVLSPGQAKWELEVLLENRIFTPLSGVVELVAPVKIEASLQSAKPKEVVVAEMVSVPKPSLNVVAERRDDDVIDVLIDSFLDFALSKSTSPTMSLLEEYENLVLDDSLRGIWKDRVRDKVIEVMRETGYIERARSRRGRTRA